MSVITHPENSATIAKYLGFSELYIPGEDDRNKQLSEISEILESGVQVEIDIDLDDHEAEFNTVQAWMKNEQGRDTRIRNPEGYLLVKEHGAAHKQAMIQEQMQQQMVAPQQ